MTDEQKQEEQEEVVQEGRKPGDPEQTVQNPMDDHGGGDPDSAATGAGPSGGATSTGGTTGGGATGAGGSGGADTGGGTAGGGAEGAGPSGGA